MKNNRDMFYQNYNQGAYAPPQVIPPSGYNINSQYQAYGPNVVPQQMENYSNYDNNFEERLSRVEKQIRNLDSRLQKLESTTQVTETESIYMI